MTPDTIDTTIVDVSQDWAAAREVQQQFTQLAGSAIDAASFSARCRQVRELGGDFYDFVPLSGNRLALAIGDASGKSLAAALMISNVQSSLRTAAAFVTNDAQAVLGAVNRQVYSTSLPDRYATLFYGVFDAATRVLRYINAGHHPPLVIRQDGSSICLDGGGPPIGIFPNWEYEERSIQLNTGDLLLAYTDGVIEAVNPVGEEWRVEGLRNTAVQSNSQNVDAFLDAIFATLDSFSHSRQTDDATLLALRVL